MTPTLRLQSPPRRPAGGPRAALAAVLLLLALAGCQGGDEFTSEGSPSSRISLTIPTLARESQVGPGTSSYYEASTINPDTSYSVYISELVEDADLYVYSDSAFTSEYCHSAQDSGTVESCLVNVGSSPASTFLFIKVKGFGENGTDFLLTVQ